MNAVAIRIGVISTLEIEFPYHNHYPHTQTSQQRINNFVRLSNNGNTTSIGSGAIPGLVALKTGSFQMTK